MEAVGVRDKVILESLGFDFLEALRCETHHEVARFGGATAPVRVKFPTLWEAPLDVREGCVVVVGCFSSDRKAEFGVS